MIDVVEQIARMNPKQRDEFVNPIRPNGSNLHMTLKKQSQIEIFEQREQKEKQELEAYSKNIPEFDDEPVPTKDMEVK